MNLEKKMSSKKIIVALDNNNLKQTINLVKILKNDAFAFKVKLLCFL